MSRSLYIALLLLTGCSTIKQHQQTTQEITATQQQGDEQLNQLQQKKRSHFTLHREPWFSKQAVAIQSPRLPAHFNREIGLASTAPMPVNAFSKLIHKLCGLPLRITPDALLKLQGERSRTSTDQSFLLIEGIRWQGPLEGLLDTVAAGLGLSWKYSAGLITLYYLESQTFQIYAIPSETKMRSTVQSGIDLGKSSEQGSSKEQGQSAQTTSVSLKSSMVQDIHRNIQSMLTTKVGQMSIATSTGTITVTDTPDTLDRVARYIRYENKTITKQVLLNIKLLSVELTQDNQMGINWNKLLYDGGNSLLKSVSAASPQIMTAAGNNATVTILGSERLNSPELLLNALAKQGKVSIVTSPSVTTLNLQPVPVQIATQEGYLAQVEVTKSRGEHSTSLKPGMITYGFNMSLLPFVMADNQLLLQYAINLSELINLQTFGEPGESQIQLPKINTRLFSQKVKLRSNETLVISGFEQIRNEAGRRGVGDAKNWLLGGGVDTKQKRNIIVLMITPVILESPCPH
jgi:type IVB pilus formation R64 PilN family outer membrane protein